MEVRDIQMGRGIEPALVWSKIVRATCRSGHDQLWIDRAGLSTCDRMFIHDKETDTQMMSEVL
jgi:hypothetical protein